MKSKKYKEYHEHKLRELDKAISSGNYSLTSVQRMIMDEEHKANDEIENIDTDIRTGIYYQSNLFNYEFLKCGAYIVSIILGIVGLANFNVTLSILGVTLPPIVMEMGLLMFNKNYRMGKRLERRNISIDNLWEERNGLSLYLDAYKRMDKKVTKRVGKRNAQNKELPKEVVDSRNYAEAMVENYYNDLDLQELIAAVHQDIVSAENLAELKTKIKDIRANLALLEKVHSMRRKMKVARKLESTAEDVHYLYSDLADEYENNRVRKLLEDD